MNFENTTVYNNKKFDIIAELPCETARLFKEGKLSTLEVTEYRTDINETPMIKIVSVDEHDIVHTFKAKKFVINFITKINWKKELGLCQ